MSHPIHARKTAKNIRYRIWNTEDNTYLTEPMTEKQLKAWTLQAALDQARWHHEHTFPQRLELANAKGTSYMLGNGRDLEGDWDKEGT